MKHLIKPLILCAMVLIAFFSIKHFKDQELVLETREKVSETASEAGKNIEETSNNIKDSELYKEAKKDLEHTVSVAKDLIGYSKTGESSYSSGIDAIRGSDTSGDKEVSLSDDAKDLMEVLSYIAKGTTDVSSQEASLEKVTLVHVADGDTVSVIAADGYEYRVRFIGMDTPESVNPDESKNNELGVIASSHTKEILTNVDTLYLEYDKEKTDQYGRILAYVWLSEDTTDLMNMLNARLIAEGYAVDKVYEPNTKYASQFGLLKIAARESGNGLWSGEEFAGLMGE